MYGKLIGIVGLAFAADCFGAPPCLVDASSAADESRTVPYEADSRRDTPALPVTLRSGAVTERVGVRPLRSGAIAQPVRVSAQPASAPREFGWAGDAATAIAAATGDAPLAPAPPPAALEAPRLSEPAPPVAPEPTSIATSLTPPLDVAMLENRLRNTDAIGLFTKLELRNQMDDLLEQFRTHYSTEQPGGVDALRQPYDLLLLKVLALLQDRDPTLASTILGSREAIWGMLADRGRFIAEI